MLNLNKPIILVENIHVEYQPGYKLTLLRLTTGGDSLNICLPEVLAHDLYKKLREEFNNSGEDNS